MRTPGRLVKVLWHDGTGMSLYAKWLERGRFVWPQAEDGVVALTRAMLSMVLGRAQRCLSSNGHLPC